MDLDDSSSPDEREFPGLYERSVSKSKKSAEEGEASAEILPSSKKADGKKDKKAKEKKDRQSYAALGGESEEDDPECKLFRSPSKSKKLKTFKFPSTKKEKREKSREPVDAKDAIDGVIKDKKLKEDPKSDKKKAKKEKKSKSNSLTSGEAFELGGEFTCSEVVCNRAYCFFFRHPTDIRGVLGTGSREIPVSR